MIVPGGAALFQLSVPSVLPSFDIARVKLPATGLAPEFAEALTALLPGVVLPQFGGSGRQALAEGGKELPDGVEVASSDDESPDPDAEGAIAWLPAPLAATDPIPVEASADDLGPAEIRLGHVVSPAEAAPPVPTGQREQVSAPVAAPIALAATPPTPAEDRPATPPAAIVAGSGPTVSPALDPVATALARPPHPTVREPGTPHPVTAVGAPIVSPDRVSTTPVVQTTTPPAARAQPLEPATPPVVPQDVDSPTRPIAEGLGETLVAWANPAAAATPTAPAIPAARAAPIAILADVVPTAPQVAETSAQPVVESPVRASPQQPAPHRPEPELVASDAQAPSSAISPRAEAPVAIVLPRIVGTPLSAPASERPANEASAMVRMSEPVLARTDPAPEPAARATPVVTARREAAPEAIIPAAPTIPLAEALAPLRRPAPRDSTAMVTVTQLAPEAPRLPSAPQPIDAAAQGQIDTSRDQWMATMIERIEALRDAAPVRETSLRLAPDALGTLDVTVTQDGDGIQVHFTVETAAARALISDAQPRLVELAEARGLRVTQTSVDAGAAGQGQGQGQRQEPTRASAPAPARTAAESASTDERIA
jgi:hypothetical protein